MCPQLRTPAAGPKAGSPAAAGSGKVVELHALPQLPRPGSRLRQPPNPAAVGADAVKRWTGRREHRGQLSSAMTARGTLSAHLLEQAHMSDLDQQEMEVAEVGAPASQRFSRLPIQSVGRGRPGRTEEAAPEGLGNVIAALPERQVRAGDTAKP